MRSLQQRIPTYGSGKRPQSELEQLAREESVSYIRIVKPQFFDETIEQGTPAFYQASRAHLDVLLQAHALDVIPNAMFLYEQQQPNIAPLRGIILAVGAQNCADGTVKKHENVIESKADRLVKHIEVLQSISEPVLLTQTLPDNIKAWLHGPKLEEPLVENTDVLGFTHRIWLLSEQEQRAVLSGFETLDSLYIADGHHRVAAVTKYLQESGLSDTQGLMSLVMDQDDLLIKSFHRIIKGVGDTDVVDYFEKNQIRYSAVSEYQTANLVSNQAMVMTRAGVYRFDLGSPDPSLNAVEQLEVTRIESGILRDLMGIENTSNDSRISFMRGDTPLNQMKDMVDQGECDCVFVLPANSFSQVEAVADQNLTMPPKSTWVEPKLLTGLVSQLFD
ncbi:MAG: hypothetical protein RLZZ504_941 [Bacteroidota bacterium]